METKHRNSPLVLDLRINLTIGLVIGDHLPAPIEPDERSVVAANVFLELRPIAATRQPFKAGPGSVPRHPLTAAEFNVVAASESQFAGMLLLIEPPGNIHLMAIGGIFVERRQVLEQGNLSAQAAADRIHQVSPHLAAGIRQSIRKLRVFGVEQYTHGLARTRRQYHRPGADMPLFPA